MKKTSGVWQYLEKSGMLEHGTAEEIQTARAEYWKAYRNTYNKTQRVKYTVTLTHAEQAEMLKATARHRRKPATFLRLAAFAYMHSSFLTPDQKSVQEIRILLSKMYCLLQAIEEDNRDSKGQSALELMQRLEADVLRCLTEPIKTTSAG